MLSKLLLIALVNTFRIGHLLVCALKSLLTLASYWPTLSLFSRIYSRLGPHFYPGCVKTITSPEIFAVSGDIYSASHGSILSLLASHWSTISMLANWSELLFLCSDWSILGECGRGAREQATHLQRRGAPEQNHPRGESTLNILPKMFRHFEQKIVFKRRNLTP